MSGSNINLLEKFINYTAERSKLINQNIANTSTKNYHSKDLSFQDIMDKELNNSLKTDNSKHIQIENTTIDYKNNIIESSEILDDQIGYNNVEIDKEMVKLAENTIKFKFASKKIGGYYKELQKVIKGNA